MHTLNQDLFYDIGGPAETYRPRRKTVVDRLTNPWAIRQILGERFLYEVHGPFVAVEPEQPRHCPSKWPIDRLSAWMRGLVHRVRLHRAACDLAELDDRMLRDIGLNRSEIGGAASGAPGRDRYF